MRISDWSSDVCSSDLGRLRADRCRGRRIPRFGGRARLQDPAGGKRVRRHRRVLRHAGAGAVRHRAGCRGHPDREPAAELAARQRLGSYDLTTANHKNKTRGEETMTLKLMLAATAAVLLSVAQVPAQAAPEKKELKNGRAHV